MCTDSRQEFAMVDKLSFVMQECTFITSVMRKSAKSAGGPLAMLLGSQFSRDGAPFLDDDYGPKLPNFLKASTKFKEDDHFLSGFVELRSILSDVDSVEEVDILTLLQPFLLLIKSPNISCFITGVAVNSLAMFLKYGIVSKDRPNIHQCITQIVSALSHCRFEGSDQTQDDILLVKIIQLLEQIALSDLGDLLRDDSMYEIISTCLSVAINTRRREMLRSAADTSLLNITEKIFSKLKYIEAQSVEDHNIKSTEFELETAENVGLPDDTIGGTAKENGPEETPEAGDNGEEDNVTDQENGKQEQVEADDEEAVKEEQSHEKEETNVTVNEKARSSSDTENQAVASDSEEFKPYGLPCMREYLIHTIDILSPHNQPRFTEGSRLLALEILDRVIEVSGPVLQKHPTLFQLISDKGCHHLVQLIRTSSSTLLLSQSLKLFLDLLINVPDHLKLQFEMIFRTIIDNIVADWSMLEKDLDRLNKTVFNMSEKGKFETVTLTEEEIGELSKEFDTSKQPVLKEILIETLSVVWCRTPYLFINFFKAYDCDFERSDITMSLIKLLCRLSGSDASLFTTGSVPPICMEGLLSLVDGIFERVKTGTRQRIEMSKLKTHPLILQRSKKADFIECTKIWNKKPKKGLEQLQEKGFITNMHEDKEVAKFLFEKSARIDKTELGEVLAKPANINLLREFVNQMDFRNIRPDEALRLMLNNFRLPGEAQQIARIVECFDDRYAECQEAGAANPESAEVNDSNKEQEKTTAGPVEEKVVPDKDALFVLSYSIILLNTDLHNPNVKKPMTVEEYQRNLRGCYNGKDFPSWYTERIYHSIEEREIVMAEDFKGTSKWLESEWRSLIGEQESKSSGNSEVGSIVSANGESLEDLLQFDRRIFQNTARYVISTLVTMFDSDEHDSIATRMMSTVEKCATIAAFFEFDDILDSIVEIVSHLTTLTGLKKSGFTLESDEHVPSVQMKLEKGDDSITVSELSVLFGKDFRAQISLIVLLRILKRTGYKISSKWTYVLQILFKLFDENLIDPNAFPEFQTKLNLVKLSSPKPAYQLNRSRALKDSGLFSTFSSYLKGLSDDTPEPTDEEVECTLSTVECIKSSNLDELFRNVSKTSTENLNHLVAILLDVLPSKEHKGDRGFKERTLYLLEVCVCYLLLSGDQQLITEALKKCESALDPDLKFDPSELARISAYQLLLLHNGSEQHADILDRCMDELSRKFDKERDQYLKSAITILQPLEMLVLTKDVWCEHKLSTDSKYWNLMRAFASAPKMTPAVYEFMESLMDERPELITYENYMDILGLLDEISAVGAYGAQWEQEYDKLEASGIDTEKGKNPFQELVDTASKSIALTAKLALLIDTPTFLESLENSKSSDSGKKVSPWYPLIEAISHQCYNPCRELRECALRALTNLLVSDVLPMEKLSPESVVDAGCFRLLIELSNPDVTSTDPRGMLKTQQDVINLTCKTILLYKLDDINQEASKLLTLTNKLLSKNSSRPDFNDEVLEIIGNALRVKASELDFRRLTSLNVRNSFKIMLSSVYEESEPKKDENPAIEKEVEAETAL
ncbi:DEKNAAC102799 [Brettanomyces naardenensis]|uniref:DEKNAAC102799 n=1 Tax=Brettanomyces naardenensis TaxID=13370 RepID=A0A448YKU1_BRENA|nr:DEKNAAC102799 [Brettanomyces naardenensis]